VISVFAFPIDESCIINEPSSLVVALFLRFHTTLASYDNKPPPHSVQFAKSVDGNPPLAYCAMERHPRGNVALRYGMKSSLNPNCVAKRRKIASAVLPFSMKMSSD